MSILFLFAYTGILNYTALATSALLIRTPIDYARITTLLTYTSAFLMLGYGHTVYQYAPALMQDMQHAYTNSDWVTLFGHFSLHTLILIACLYALCLLLETHKRSKIRLLFAIHAYSFLALSILAFSLINPPDLVTNILLKVSFAATCISLSITHIYMVFFLFRPTSTIATHLHTYTYWYYSAQKILFISAIVCTCWYLLYA